MTVIRDAEVEGRRVHIRFDGHTVLQVSPHAMTPLRGEEVVDAAGGAVLPGLHDHHIHLLATARAQTSIDVSQGLEPLATAPSGTGWLRAVNGMDELDAATLDRVVPDRPVRVQHHSGAMWALNSVALLAVGAGNANEPGIERDDRKAGFGELARQRPSAGAGTDDREVDLLVVVVGAHVDPLAGAKHVGRSALHRTRFGDITRRPVGVASDPPMLRASQRCVAFV